jgi:glycine cleavage system aminomethyltransferase T
LGNEPVISDGRVVSRTTSGGIGYTVGESIAYTYLPLALAEVSTDLAVEIDGRSVSARVEREPRFDPTNSRIKA